MSLCVDDGGIETVVFVVMQYGPLSVETVPWILIFMTINCASLASMLCSQACQGLQITTEKTQGDRGFDVQRKKVIISLFVYCMSLYASVKLSIYAKQLSDAKIDPSYLINVTYLVCAVLLVLSLSGVVFSLGQYYRSQHVGRVCSIQDEVDPPLFNTKV